MSSSGPDGVTLLILSEAELEAARARGAALNHEPLLTAEQLETQTAVPAARWLGLARQRRVPCYRIGKAVRFRLSEAVGAFKQEAR